MIRRTLVTLGIALGLVLATQGIAQASVETCIQKAAGCKAATTSAYADGWCRSKLC